MRLGTIGMLLVVATVVLAACAPQATRAPAPQATAPSPAAAPLKPAVASAAARPAWQEKWETTLAAAKKEGRFVLVSTGGSDLRSVITKGIKDAYGLEAEVLSGRSGEIEARLFAERRAGLYNADVCVGSTGTTVNNLKPAGALEPIDSALILPEVTDPKVWYKESFPWVDKDHMVIAFSIFPGRAIAINTTLVKPSDLKSWRDLLDPKWKGKLALNDPTVAGAGSLSMQAMDGIMGWDYVKELAKAEPIIIRDQRQQLEWLAHGKISILIAPKPDVFTSFVKVGAPVALVDPAEGNWLSCGVGVVSLFNNAPHPNASRVFLNWLLSKDGQLLFSQAILQQSARLDIPTAGLPPDLVRQPGVKYFVTFDEAGLARRTVTDKMGKELFAPLVNK